LKKLPDSKTAVSPASARPRARIRRVGVVANSGKAAARQMVQAAARIITRSGRAAVADRSTAELGPWKHTVCPDIATLTRQCDLILVFGGDGTMLRVAREMDGSRTPILGVNLGGLGFLTDVPATGLAAGLRHIWDGEFTLETRALIEAHGNAQARFIHACALNDFVVSRGIVSRLIELEVKVDGETLTRYRCDGLIVSSPTGSTAYSLAAGGAVVCPTAEVFTLTPICPHTLSNRSVVVSLSSSIDVKVISEKPETVLSGDGQHISELASGDTVTIQRSRHAVRLVRLPGSSFFQTLRHKLRWSGSSIPARG
jgi:NAD+ kinase